MIYVKKGGNVVRAYMMEGFRRLYSASIDRNGQYVDFDAIMAKATVASSAKKIIPFEDIFCFRHMQKEIIADLLNESYCYIGYNKQHKLKKHLKNSVSLGLTLGPSPNSSLKSFLKKNPHLKSLFTEEDLARDKIY